MHMNKRLVVAGAIAVGLVVLALPGRAMNQTPQPNPNLERCNQIEKILKGEGRPGEGLGQMRRTGRTWVYEGGEIGRAQAELRAAEDAANRDPNVADLQFKMNKAKAEVNRLAGLINRFTDQLSELKCDGAPPKVEDLTGGGTGGAAEATPTPTPTATPGPGSGDRGGRGPAAPIDPNNWKGDWNTDYGTLTLVFNQDTVGTRDMVASKNSWGPASNCPDTALVFGGEISMKSGNWGPQIEAPVVACAVAGVLEGKFNNTKNLTSTEATTGRIRVGYFKLTMSVVNGKYSFAGNVLRWNHVNQSPFEGFSIFFSGRR
jgi:hypothetical protein